MRRISDILRDRRGATAIEYGLIVGLIVIAILAGIANLAGATIGMWNDVSDQVVRAG